ncbi:MAG TPA: hypothetical protein VHE30_14750 [Polyangiaceae bacterium]|nr:hypothetical protein [Polyangiaceae bacterium]
MRPLSLLLVAGLLASSGAAGAAPPKKPAPAAAHARGKPAGHAAPATSAAPEGTGEDSPYGDTPAPTATATAASAPSAAATEAAPSPETTSGDAKLDAPPPPQTKESTGPKPSPLTPEAAELSKPAAPAAPVALDKLMADIATLRARVAALTTSLFSSKLRVYVRTEGDDARIEAFVLTLDDGVVFRGDAGFFAEDEKVVFDHALAPGSHVIGLEVERKDARGPAFRTWQTSRFAVQVPERKTLEAIVVVKDDSDMADDFPDDQDGQYDLRVKLRAKVAE